MSHSRERRPSVGKTGEEKDELALYKCLTSAAGRSSGGKKNGEVNKYDEQKGWVSSRMGGGGVLGGLVVRNTPIIEAENSTEDGSAGV